MCIGKPECQRCTTCGRLKYQLWVSKEMHDRGCPFGYQQMDACPETRNHARMLRWALDNGVVVKPTGDALVAQMEAAGVDLHTPPEAWEIEA
jgi:hypothetical protein